MGVRLHHINSVARLKAVRCRCEVVRSSLEDLVGGRRTLEGGALPLQVEAARIQRLRHGRLKAVRCHCKVVGAGHAVVLIDGVAHLKAVRCRCKQTSIVRTAPGDSSHT
jgi:hypothetical protein